MIDGLVIGSRKAGTSWLHANLLNDPYFSTTVHTKETNYWGTNPRCSKLQYNKIFQQNSGSFRVECDASLCTDPITIEKLVNAKVEPSIILILRNPRDFLVSRFIHSRRKGEIANSTQLEDFLMLDWVQAEINYELILNKFTGKFPTNVLKFEKIHENPYLYYKQVCSCLNSDYQQDENFVLETNKVNQMRTSRFPILSKAQTSLATGIRNMGFHKLVNSLKKTGIHSFLEVKEDQSSKDNLYIKASNLNHDSLLKSHQIWLELE